MYTYDRFFWFHIIPCYPLLPPSIIFKLHGSPMVFWDASHDLIEGIRCSVHNAACHWQSWKSTFDSIDVCDLVVPTRRSKKYQNCEFATTIIISTMWGLLVIKATAGASYAAVAKCALVLSLFINPSNSSYKNHKPWSELFAPAWSSFGGPTLCPFVDDLFSLWKYVYFP